MLLFAEMKLFWNHAQENKIQETADKNGNVKIKQLFTY